MPPETNSKEIDFKSYLAPLRGRRRFVITWVVGVAVVALIYNFVVPATWKANATILTVIPSDDFSGSGAAGQGLAALSPNAPDPLQILEGVILSRQSLNLIISRTHIARKRLAAGLKTDRRQKQALLTISWEDQDRKQALTVVQGALDGVTKINHDIGFSTAALQAKFLEKSVFEQEQKLTTAEEALAAYEKGMKAPVDPSNPAGAGAYLKEKKDLQLQLGVVDAQLKVARDQAHVAQNQPNLPTMIPNAKPYRDKLVGMEYDLQVALTTLGPAAPKVVALKKQIEVTRDTLNQEIARYLQSVQANLDPSIAVLEATKLTVSYQLGIVNDLANRAPTEAINLARLAREVSIAGQISTTLRSKWEQAKVAAEVDQVKWAVLEEPFIEDEPTNKHLVRTPVMGGVLGFMIAFGILNWKERKKVKAQGANGSAK